jgi:hypothetical protein
MTRGPLVTRADREAAQRIRDLLIVRLKEQGLKVDATPAPGDDELDYAFAEHRRDLPPAKVDLAVEVLGALGWQIETRGGMRVKVEDDGGVGTASHGEMIMYDALVLIGASAKASVE